MARIVGDKPLEPDLDRLAEIEQAVMAFSLDQGMQDDKRGIDTFCRHFDRWLDEAAEFRAKEAV